MTRATPAGLVVSSRPATARTCRRSSTPAPSGALPAEVVAVVSDQPTAHALERAAAAGVPGRARRAPRAARRRERLRRTARRRRQRVRAGLDRARRVDADPHDVVPRLVPGHGDQPPSGAAGRAARARRRSSARSSQAQGRPAHVDRRHGAPRARRRRRHRADAWPRPSCRSTPTTRFETLAARMHAAEHGCSSTTLAELCTRTSRADS